MQPMRHAARGAALLCAALFLAACSTSGKPRDTGIAIQTQLIDRAHQQLVPIRSTLTEIPTLAPAPAPAVPPGPDCNRALGCYSNSQLEALLSSALDWGGKATDNLRAIRQAGEEATKGNPR